MHNRIQAPLQSILFPLILFFSIAFSAETPASTWQIGTLDATGDVGRYCELQINSSGNMYVVYLRNDGSTLKTISRTGGTWQTPEIIDESGQVGGHCAIAVNNAGIRRVSYRRSDTGALSYAGPEAPYTWSSSVLVSSPDDIGQYASLNINTPGALSVSCQNATQGSLILVTRDALGTWSAPVTIDPGPNRGSHSDHAYRPGARYYSFSERDAGLGALVFADTSRANEWTKGIIHGTRDSGRFVSLVKTPNGLASAFYHYDSEGLGAIYMVALDDSLEGAVRVVVDSIANLPDEGVYVDLAFDVDSNWHISFRNPREGGLWYGSGDSSMVTGIDDDQLRADLPRALELHQNFPNPFNPQTTIAVSLPQTTYVNLSIYDARGRLVRTLIDEQKLAGEHALIWNGRDGRGGTVASGVYFVRLTVAGQARTQKIVLLR
jgi:hypothetical protein